MRIFRTLTKGQVRRGRSNSFILPVAALAGLFLLGQSMWLKDNKYMFLPFATTKIDCEYCQGSGIVRDYGDDRVKIMCPSCLGVGYHAVRRFDEQDAICPACGGMGRTDIKGQWDFCRRCEGRGIYRVHAWRDTADVKQVEIVRDAGEREVMPDTEPATVPRDYGILRDPIKKGAKPE